MSPKYLKSVGKMKKTYFFSPKPGFRQSWTKVLGNLLQYAYFSVISPFPLKTVHFRNFLALSPPPTLYKVETRKKLINVPKFAILTTKLELSTVRIECSPKCRGSWVVGRDRGSWVWVWVIVVSKKKSSKKK